MRTAARPAQAADPSLMRVNVTPPVVRLKEYLPARGHVAEPVVSFIVSVDPETVYVPRTTTVEPLLTL